MHLRILNISKTVTVKDQFVRRSNNCSTHEARVEECVAGTYSRSYAESNDKRLNCMKIYEFPKNPQKKKHIKPPPSLVNNDRPFSRNHDGMWIEEYSEDLDIRKINRILFFRYVRWFPCFRPFKSDIHKCDLATIYEYYCSEDVFSEAQEIVFEFLVELLSPYDCGFMIKEIYLFLSREDRAALIRVFSDFSKYVH